MPQFLGRIDMYFSLCLTWSRNASAIKQAENTFAELRTGQGMRDMRGWSHFRVVSRAVNYFLSLARCYWMIVAIEICMRSKMENKMMVAPSGLRLSSSAKSPHFYNDLSNLSTPAFLEGINK